MLESDVMNPRTLGWCKGRRPPEISPVLVSRALLWDKHYRSSEYTPSILSQLSPTSVPIGPCRSTGGNPHMHTPRPPTPDTTSHNRRARPWNYSPIPKRFTSKFRVQVHITPQLPQKLTSAARSGHTIFLRNECSGRVINSLFCPRPEPAMV